LKKFGLALCLLLTLSGCGLGFNGGSSRGAINADILLLDISGSSLNGAGTYNTEDHSINSLASRQIQLRNKLSNALGENTAIYFGFVRGSYGAQELSTILAPKLFLDIDSFINEDMNNDQRKKDTRDAIAEIWNQLLNSKDSPDSNCSSATQSNLVNRSLGKLSIRHASSLANQLCGSATSAHDVILQLKENPSNLGSDIQGAVDRSLEKMSSDERRLYSNDGKPVLLNARIILVSDLIQKMPTGFLPEVLKPLKDKQAACDFAKESAGEHATTYEGSPALISDGFAGAKGKISETERDKLKEYWVCWFQTRNITDIDLGARGIDLGNL